MTQKGKATVIGLGTMGAALARALLANGYWVTVWNRDHSKTSPLSALGAIAADDIVSAIKASELIVICVSDYAATNKILNEERVIEALSDRTIVQLSTGTPAEARTLEAWATNHGATCLNGDILAWPRQIGTAEATISISGNPSVFNKYQQFLEALGTISYLGEEAGRSAVLFSAVLAYLAGSWIGFCHGALICEKEGLRVDEFGELVKNMSPMLAEESKNMGEVIQHNNFTNPESTIRTTGLDLHLLVKQAEESGINKELPQFAAGIFQRAMDAGFEAEEHAAIIKVLRKPS